MNRIAVVLCYLAVAASALAQDPAPVPGVAPDAIAVLQCDGPSLLRRRFLPTDLGSMLDGDDASGFLELVRKPLRSALAGLVAEPDALVAALDAYGGRATLSLELDEDGDAEALVVVLAPDTQEHLAAIKDTATAALRAAGNAREPLRDGERQIERVNVGGRGEITLPFALGDHLVIVAGDATIDDVVARVVARTGAGAFKPDADQAAAAFVLRFDLEQLVAILRENVKRYLEQPDAVPILRRLGFDSLRELRFSVWPAGPRVVVETALQMQGDERGLFGGFFPAVDKAPQMQRLVPKGIGAWQVVQLDPAAVFGAVFDAAESFDARNGALQELGVHLDREVFAHLGREVLVLGEPLSEGREEVEGTVCLVFSVRDTAEFDASWKVLAEKCELNSEEPKLVAGTPLHLAKTAWFGAIAHARFGELFAIGFGEQGAERIEAVITRAAAKPEGLDEPAAGELERLRRYAPPGWNGCGHVDADAATFLANVLAMMADADDELGEVGAAFRALLEKHELTRAWVMTGNAAGRFRLRLLW